MPPPPPPPRAYPELHPRFHVKSLAWQAIMGDAVLEDFVEKIVPLWPVGY